MKPLLSHQKQGCPRWKNTSTAETARLCPEPFYYKSGSEASGGQKAPALFACGQVWGLFQP